LFDFEDFHTLFILICEMSDRRLSSGERTILLDLPETCAA
jgi:hypothetical protein